jgi:hypothetical protein
MGNREWGIGNGEWGIGNRPIRSRVIPYSRFRDSRPSTYPIREYIPAIATIPFSKFSTEIHSFGA